MTIIEQEHSEIDSGAESQSRAIRDRLRDAIIDRRLAPGAKLTETEVAALFGVTRTVVHFALQMLSLEGLVRTERNRGAFVASPSLEEARQVFASRRIVEPGVAMAACQCISAKDIKAFKRQLAAEARFVAERGPSARRAEIKASGDFHLLLAAVAGNPIVLRFMGELIARSSLVIALYGRSGVSSCGHDEHIRIFEAISTRDQKLVAELLIGHLNHLEADLDLRPKTGSALKEALEL